MNRAEQLTRELYVVHKSGQHAVAYSVARIMALEELLRQVQYEDHYFAVLSEDLHERIVELVPDESTFDNDDPDSTEEDDDE